MEQRCIPYCPTPSVSKTTYKKGWSLLKVLCQVFCSLSLSLLSPNRLHVLFIFPPTCHSQLFVFPHSFFFFTFFSEGNFDLDRLETNFKVKIRSSCLMQIPWKHLRTKRVHSNYFLRTFLQHPTICSSS